MKKLLYLSDLYNYYVSQNKNVKFSSKDDDTTIVVHIDEPLIYSEFKDDELNLYCPIRLCHTLSNRNKSYISEKAMNDAIPTAYNMPILGYMYQDDSDEYQFAGHEFFVNDDNELVYEESPCGVIPESADLKLVKYDDDEKLYLEGTGIIWRTYTKASDIIEREKELNVSVELCVDELSFDSKNKELIIDKFRFSGVTILGKDRNTGDDIQPGMENSMISISDFSEVNNSVFSQNEKVIEMLSALSEKIDNLNINQDFKRKEEEDSVNKEFEEVTEEITEEITEEEIKDSPSEEVFDENEGGVDYYEEPKAEEEQQEETEEPEVTEEPKTEEPVVEPTPVVKEDGDEDGDNELTIPLGQRDDDDTDGEKKYSIDYIVDFDGVKKNFSVSLKEKLNALTTLVNDAYGESDGTWYDCDVIEETKTVEFHDWWANKHYRQSYAVKKDVYSLKGDRIETFVSFLSADEKNALEQIKANYSSIEEKLAQYEAEPEKLEILASEEYAQIKDTDAYKDLANRETYFSMSKEELTEKLDACLLEFAKHNEIKFSAIESDKKSVGVKLFGNPSKKKSASNGRYGGIFTK